MSIICTFGYIFLTIFMIIGIIITLRKLPTKKKNKLNKKKMIIIISILIGIIILAYIWCCLYHHYEIDIERKYSNSAEKLAIQKAEELDLAILLNVSRYSGWGKNGGTNNPSTDPEAYVWPNIVDKNTLDFYQNKIEKLKNNFIAVRAYLNYKAECKEYSEISISYDHVSNIIEINEYKYSIDISKHPSYESNYHCAIFINNSLEVISRNTSLIELYTINGYIITQDFEYEEHYGPLAAFGGGAEQTIVLDKDYLPKLIISKTNDGWIS